MDRDQCPTPSDAHVPIRSQQSRLNHLECVVASHDRYAKDIEDVRTGFSTTKHRQDDCAHILKTLLDDKDHTAIAIPALNSEMEEVKKRVNDLAAINDMLLKDIALLQNGATWTTNKMTVMEEHIMTQKRDNGKLSNALAVEQAARIVANQESSKLQERVRKLEERSDQSLFIPEQSRPSTSSSHQSEISTCTSAGSQVVPMPEESRKRQASPRVSTPSARRKRAKVSNPVPRMDPPSSTVGSECEPDSGANKQTEDQSTDKTTAVAASTPKRTKKVKPEPAPVTKAKSTREATPDGLSKVAKDRFRYVRELKDLDCTDFTKYKALREDVLASTYQFPLFRLEIKNEMCDFFLMTGENEALEPCPRAKVPGVLKENHQKVMDREIVEGLGVLEAREFSPKGNPVRGARSDYFLCLGEVYKTVQTMKNNKKESTGWFILMDVATKDKPVYMIWREKTFKDNNISTIATWNGAALGLGAGDRRDLFAVLHSIRDWPSDPEQFVVDDKHIKTVLERRGREMHIAFTRPLCKELVDRMQEKDGWNKPVTFKEIVNAKARKTNP